MSRFQRAQNFFKTKHLTITTEGNRFHLFYFRERMLLLPQEASCLKAPGGNCNKFNLETGYAKRGITRNLRRRCAKYRGRDPNMSSGSEAGSNTEDYLTNTQSQQVANAVSDAITWTCCSCQESETTTATLVLICACHPCTCCGT